MERIAPSARLEAQIAELLTDGLAVDGDKLAELGRLGARLVLQRAIDEEVAAFLGRARYQRTPEAAGSRNGTRPKSIQTAEGEIKVDMPQVRGTAAQFISRVFPDSRTVIRTRPLEALIIGGYVRGLSDRDIESLMQEALDWARFPRVRPVASAVSCVRAIRRSAPEVWPRWSCSRCSSTRSTCRRDRAARRRACWWPGATPLRASGC